MLVRHGQASFLGADYDRLSPTGEEQARRLGLFWSARRIRFDQVITGPRKRQIDTARVAAESFTAAGAPMPEPVVVEEFDEYDGDGILKHILPEARLRDSRLQELTEAYSNSADDAERRRSFQKMFEAATLAWIAGEIESPQVESWPSFHDRVRRAIGRITSNERRGLAVAVFTSGGPISAAVQMAAGAPERTAIELNWRLKNCSITEIAFSKGRLTLDSFNTVPHLDDPLLLTYR